MTGEKETTKSRNSPKQIEPSVCRRPIVTVYALLLRTYKAKA
ncbi:hypothetical protein CCACVL1_07176 [Corchorus capsularis]|uniref:Uncharacterized protein n=1 Tax=Corchorus capsularis TaxID=210143 RepID=A0A1R3J8U6_COCAP|nr:hypothetical protein CCACVL1_07176 [Corchorus capsularis]